MTQNRKTAAAREKDFRLAIFRIERGRAHTKATKINFTTVANEVGVKPSLIHNHYPQIANVIRERMDASALQQRDAKHDELKVEKDKNKDLRGELKAAKARIDQLASINETLLIRVTALEAAAGVGNVRAFPSKPVRKS